jgi:hypothetical protein
MSTRGFLIWLLLVSPCLAQTSSQMSFLASAPTIDCAKVKPANTEVLRTDKGFVNLSQAIALVVDAINDARCENYDPAGRFQLNTADLDFQTLVDKMARSRWCS